MLLHLEMVKGCNHLVMALDCIHLAMVLVLDIPAMVLGDMNPMVMALDLEMVLLTHNLVSAVCKQVIQHHPDNRLQGMMVYLVYLDDRILQIRLLVYLESLNSRDCRHRVVFEILRIEVFLIHHYRMEYENHLHVVFVNHEQEFLIQRDNWACWILGVASVK